MWSALVPSLAGAVSTTDDDATIQKTRRLPKHCKTSVDLDPRRLLVLRQMEMVVLYRVELSFR